MQIALENIGKSFGSDLIFRGVDARVEDRDRIGLVGINGAGKTTLLNIITGGLEPDEGTVTRGSSLSIGYQRQNAGLQKGNTILEEMRSVFADVYAMEEELQALREEMSKNPKAPGLEDRYKEVEDAFLARDGYQVQVKINTVLTGMGFAEHGFGKSIDKLSGGEQTRLAIAKLLLEQPSLLILDEPTNHLDFKTLGWLEDYLSAYKGALLVVSHDRYFLDRLCGKIWEMEYGELTVFPGNYTRYIQLRDERNVRQQKLYEAQQAEIAKLQEYVDKNLVRASTTKMAQSRRRMIERLEAEPAEKPKARMKPPIIHLNEYAAEPVKDVLLAESLDVAVGEGEKRRTLLSGVDLAVARGDKIAVIGGNGTGKSTLLKCLLGKLPANPGARITWGRGVRSSYYDQGSDHLDSSLTVLDTLWEYYPRSYETPLRNMLGAMGLKGEDVFKRVSQLSGGEKARLKLAVICLAKSNVLILDEPTNHLDLATKEVLEAALQEFTGTLIMVSHDRYLLDRVPTRIWELEGGQLRQYKGRYTDYLRTVSGKPEPKTEEKPEKKPEQSGYSKGKEQRRADAQRRREYAETEKLVAQLEAEVWSLEQQIASPEAAADYLLLQDLCAQVEEKRDALSRAEDRWLELSE
ncbi:MAG: ABC-F family ATP-binding cassette domain-containing protein [Angelakisella sp.]|nr:ABC-F family ATP-binding cassette domain-containing protein [Angelakisella sp.]